MSYSLVVWKLCVKSNCKGFLSLWLSLNKTIVLKLDMVAHDYNASIWDVEAEGSVIQGHPCNTANSGPAWSTWDSVSGREREFNFSNLVSCTSQILDKLFLYTCIYEEFSVS